MEKQTRFNGSDIAELCNVEAVIILKGKPEHKPTSSLNFESTCVNYILTAPAVISVQSFGLLVLSM